MLLLAAAALAHAHGGPPEIEVVAMAHGAVLGTTHGFLLQRDGAWRWLCEELTGASYWTDVTLTPSGRIVVATTAGVLHSDDGCAWDLSDGLGDPYVGRLRWDGDALWAVSDQGLWRSTDEGRAFSLDLPLPAGASGRDFLLGDAVVVLGFQDGAPTAWRREHEDWQASELPAEGGQLHALGAGATGRVFLRAPHGTQDALLSVGSDRAADVLLETDAAISAFDIGPEADTLHVGLSRIGVITSRDGGWSWSEPGPGAGLPAH